MRKYISCLKVTSNAILFYLYRWHIAASEIRIKFICDDFSRNKSQFEVGQVFALSSLMPRFNCPQLSKFDQNQVRTTLENSIFIADQLLANEKRLIHQLYEIDQKKFFILYGYKSLMGYCNFALRLSRTQSQRIVSNVRRYEPTVKIKKNGV